MHAWRGFNTAATDVPDADPRAWSTSIAKLLREPGANPMEVGLAPMADEIQSRICLG
jgi:hypothetical protein